MPSRVRIMSRRKWPLQRLEIGPNREIGKKHLENKIRGEGDKKKVENIEKHFKNIIHNFIA